MFELCQLSGLCTREQMTGNRGTVLAHILIKFDSRIEKSSENKAIHL